MSEMREFASRVANYWRRHGLLAMISRSALFVRRMVTGGRMALFFCDLNALKAGGAADLKGKEDMPKVLGFGQGQREGDLVDAPDLWHATVEQKSATSQLEDEDLQKIGSAWNVAITQRLHAERFDKGATLWLFKLEGKLAGYGWTMIGGAMEPHFFPLGANDAHLFDFFVFPEFRGRRINPVLVNHILKRLAKENRSRAFIEAAEWNAPQLSSLARTPFRALGYARKIHFFGKEMVLWSGKAKEESAANL